MFVADTSGGLLVAKLMQEIDTKLEVRISGADMLCEKVSIQHSQGGGKVV